MIIQKLANWAKLAPVIKTINLLIDKAESQSKLTVRGPGTSITSSPQGTTINVKGPSTRRLWTTWRVSSATTVDAAGDANDYVAYYTCNPVTYDATDYNLTNTDPVEYDSDTEVIVCNLSERGSDTSAIVTEGELLIGFSTFDDDGNLINLGWPAPAASGKVYRAKTQEAAQADLYISVKLADSTGATPGSAFDALALSQDGTTALNAAAPLIQTAKYVFVSRINGVWYLLETFTKMDICT